MSEKIVQLNEEVIKGQLKELVRGGVEEILNELLEAEAQKLTQAARYERNEQCYGGRLATLDSNAMIDLSKVQNYYVACGYTDLRRGISTYFSLHIFAPKHDILKNGNNDGEGVMGMKQEYQDRKDTQALVDIRDVKLDSSLEQTERIRSFLRQIKNPYRFKVGDVVVDVAYTEGSATLNDCFADMLSIL